MTCFFVDTNFFCKLVKGHIKRWNRIQSKKIGPQKALLKLLIWNAQNGFSSFVFPQLSIQYLMTFAVHYTKGSVGWSEYNSPHKQNVNLQNEWWSHSLVCRYNIKPKVQQYYYTKGLDLQETLLPKPILRQRLKHILQRQKETEDSISIKD